MTDKELTQAEKDALDAARYRWLRECHGFRSDRVVTVCKSDYIDGQFQGKRWLDGADLDEYIDAQLQGRGHW